MRVADFGMSRVIEVGDTGQTRTNVVPFREAAPECERRHVLLLLFAAPSSFLTVGVLSSAFKGTYTTKSDVFAFGGVLWQVTASIFSAV